MLSLKWLKQVAYTGGYSFRNEKVLAIDSFFRDDLFNVTACCLYISSEEET